MAPSTSKCRGCLNKTNSFCYVCGNFTTVAQRRTFTSLIRTAYFHYFDCKIGDQDKSWAPHICGKPCYNGLTAWFNGKKAAFNFAVPMVWREPRNHADDCYFCLTNITGFNASSRKKKSNIPTFDLLWDPFPIQIFGRYWVYIFRNKWQWATLDRARRPEWSCSWFVSVKTAVRALGFSA